MLAYLVVGGLLGPHGLRALEESNEVEAIAEFGVVFLMFSIGPSSFSLQRLQQAMRRLVFGFGAAQLAFTASATALATTAGLRQDWRAGVVVGLAVAMSSTAIVAKMLSERFELHSRSGRQTMGVLLFQDIAVVPCLILFPALTQTTEELPQALAIALAQALAVLFVLIRVGQKWIRRITTAWRAIVPKNFRAGNAPAHRRPVLHQRQRRPAAGAGGLHRRHADLGNHLSPSGRGRHPPYRDMLLGLFFVTVGMMLDLAFVFRQPPPPACWRSVLLIVGKGLVHVAGLIHKKSAERGVRAPPNSPRRGNSAWC